MKLPTFTVAALMLLSLGSTVPAAAQASACRPADATSARMLQWVKGIATGSGAQQAALRAEMKIPLVSATQVTYVTDKTVCSKAVSPYNSITGIGDSTAGTAIAPSGELYVVKAGTVYVVWDPVKVAGEYALYVTLNSKFTVLWNGVG
jgi:hypothetical protein